MFYGSKNNRVFNLFRGPVCRGMVDQFAAEKGGQLNAELGDQFARILHLIPKVIGKRVLYLQSDVERVLQYAQTGHRKRFQ